MQNNRYRSYSGRRGVSAGNFENENCLCEEQPISLAMAYVKRQKFGKVYGAEDALSHGTLFPDLYMPYEGGRRR